MPSWTPINTEPLVIPPPTEVMWDRALRCCIETEQKVGFAGTCRPRLWRTALQRLMHLPG